MIKRVTLGSIISIVGFLLSPLSWWNDLIINIPLSYFVASIISFFNKDWFLALFVLAYFGTNVLGLFLLQKGVQKIKNSKSYYTIKSLAKDLAFCFLYMLIIIVLVSYGIISPPSIGK